MFEMVTKATIFDLCASRNAALDKMKEAIVYINEGARLAGESWELGALSRGGEVFKRGHAARVVPSLFPSSTGMGALETYRREIDASAWWNVYIMSGMDVMMDRTEKEKFAKSLDGDIAPFTEENFEATFSALIGDANLIFARGLARTFSDLDRRFKSHDGFKLGSRIILTRVFDEYGSWNYHSRMRDTIADIERVFAILDNKQPEIGALARAIEKDRKGYNARQSESETEYFRINCFKNGNAHLWFKRDDLVNRANKVLAAYYGEVLPDAAPKNYSPDDLRTKSGLPAKNLSFYATPDEVCVKLMREVDIPKGARTLEPSAGTGAIVRHLLAKGAIVDAIEIDPERAQSLRGIRNNNLTVTNANFLTTTPRAVYDLVVMNPPFYHTHWMEHVLHAFDFLNERGVLLAVLPVTAETGDTRKHEEFRAWVAKHSDWRAFTDLPPESFAESGTRVNTVILRVRK